MSAARKCCSPRGGIATWRSCEASSVLRSAVTSCSSASQKPLRTSGSGPASSTAGAGAGGIPAPVSVATARRRSRGALSGFTTPFAGPVPRVSMTVATRVAAAAMPTAAAA